MPVSYQKQGCVCHDANFPLFKFSTHFEVLFILVITIHFAELFCSSARLLSSQYHVYCKFSALHWKCDPISLLQLSLFVFLFCLFCEMV